MEETKFLMTYLWYHVFKLISAATLLGQSQLPHSHPALVMDLFAL